MNYAEIRAQEQTDEAKQYKQQLHEHLASNKSKGKKAVPVEPDDSEAFADVDVSALRFPTKATISKHSIFLLGYLFYS